MGHKGDKQLQRGAWSLFMCVPPCTATTEHIHGQLNDACRQAGRQRARRRKRIAPEWIFHFHCVLKKQAEQSPKVRQRFPSWPQEVRDICAEFCLFRILPPARSVCSAEPFILVLLQGFVLNLILSLQRFPDWDPRTSSARVPETINICIMRHSLQAELLLGCTLNVLSSGRGC